MLHTPYVWQREGNLIYALEPHGWKHGVEQFRNRFEIRIFGGPDTPAEELDAIAQLIMAAPDMLAYLKRRQAENRMYRTTITELDELIKQAETIPYVNG